MGFFDKFKKNKQKSVEERLAHIEVLRKEEPAKKKKKDDEHFGDDDRAVSQLIEYLADESPECRKAAANALKEAKKEMAVTGLRNAVMNEKDPEVEKVMREAMVQVRKNIEANR